MHWERMVLREVFCQVFAESVKNISVIPFLLLYPFKRQPHKMVKHTRK